MLGFQMSLPSGILFKKDGNSPETFFAPEIREERLMSEAGVRGIDLFKIAGESISGWIPSWKTGETRPTRQPFCSLME